MTAASVKALNKGFGVSSLYQVGDILSSGYLAKEKKKDKNLGKCLKAKYSTFKCIIERRKIRLLLEGINLDKGWYFKYSGQEKP